MYFSINGQSTGSSDLFLQMTRELVSEHHFKIALGQGGATFDHHSLTTPIFTHLWLVLSVNNLRGCEMINVVAKKNNRSSASQIGVSNLSSFSDIFNNCTSFGPQKTDRYIYF